MKWWERFLPAEKKPNDCRHARVRIMGSETIGKGTCLFCNESVFMSDVINSLLQEMEEELDRVRRIR